MLSRDAGTYRIIPRTTLTPCQMAVLQRAGQRRILSRLAALVGQGAIAASGAQRFYAAYRRTSALHGDVL